MIITNILVIKKPFDQCVHAAGMISEIGDVVE